MTKILRACLTVFATAMMALLPAALQAQSTNWTIDRNASAIRFSGTHAGKDFTGRFGQWTARIRFDPDDLPASRIIVVIDTASAATGNKVQETTLENSEWFDSSNHRFATFSSTAITARGGNRYQARGVLEIKGKETPVTLPFTLGINGDRARATGTLTLDRIALGLGTKSDPRAQFVSRNIELAMAVSASR